MAFAVDDTIAAVASPNGPSARSIVRISGPETLACLQRCFVSPTPLESQQRAMVVQGELRLGERQVPCDLFYWPTKRSYTKQPAAELHLPGGDAVADRALETICQSEVRLARAGEFTMRAFLAGRIDLPQAEAVLGVIDATNQRALDQALVQLAGGLSSSFCALRDRLLDLLAEIEAGLDFVDEDIEFVSKDQTLSALATALNDAQSIYDQVQARCVSHRVPTAVLLGEANAGKSSLFNAICDGEAIVSGQSGTTRDYVTGTLTAESELGAICNVVDTAGYAGAADDQLGGSHQSRSLEKTAAQRDDAEILLICIDATQPMSQVAGQLLKETATSSRIVIATKCDLIDLNVHPSNAMSKEQASFVSSKTGQGVPELIGRIRDEVVAIQDVESTVVKSTATRCRTSLENLLRALERCIALTEEDAGTELVASELRVGLDQLGEIVGTVYTDDLLDRIFGKFCIGK